MAKASQRHAKNEWGTPDPRDADAYPKPTSATPMAQWAWEFLRRRSDYRAWWDRLVRPFIDGRGGYDEAAVYRHIVESDASVRRKGGTYLAPWEAMRREFRVCGSPLNGVLDPRSNRPPFFEVVNVSRILALGNDVKIPEVLISFDVSLPLDPQLKDARRVLEYARRELPDRGEKSARSVKLRIDKFPDYLRLLDFEAAGAPDREISEHLFKNQSGERLRDTVRKTFAAAHRWQDDYLIVALHNPDGS